MARAGASSDRWKTALADKDGPAGRSLHSALEAELGETLGGRGHQLLTRIAERYSEFLARTAARADYAQAQTTIAGLADELSAVQAELSRSETASLELACRPESAWRASSKRDRLLRARAALRAGRGRVAAGQVSRVRPASGGGAQAGNRSRGPAGGAELPAAPGELAWVQTSGGGWRKSSRRWRPARLSCPIDSASVPRPKSGWLRLRRRCWGCRPCCDATSIWSVSFAWGAQAGSHRHNLQQARAAEVQGRALMDRVRSLRVDDALLRQLRELQGNCEPPEEPRCRRHPCGCRAATGLGAAAGREARRGCRFPAGDAEERD